MAEIEIGIFTQGYISRRVPDEATLRERIAAMEAERNQTQCVIHWRFTSRKARRKLAHLYPIEQI